MSIGDLEGDAHGRLVAIIRSLADTKLLLGYHYNERVYGAPSIEDANAIQGQAANEFGQAKHFLSIVDKTDDSSDDLAGRSDPDTY